MNMQVRRSAYVQILLLVLALLAVPAQASVMPISIGAFPAGSTLLTFDGYATGTEVNGLIVSGVQFQYSLGNGKLLMGGGPGVTNNIYPQNITAGGPGVGTLKLTLPNLVNAFGYGYAVLSFDSVPNATTITLFDGTTNVGSLSYNGLLDPEFAGGFAGIQSTIPFNNAVLSFNALAFAVDNVSIGPAAVPEPSTIILLLSWLAGLVWIRLRRSSSHASKNA